MFRNGIYNTQRQQQDKTKNQQVRQQQKKKVMKTRNTDICNNVLDVG